MEVEVEDADAEEMQESRETAVLPCVVCTHSVERHELKVCGHCTRPVHAKVRARLECSLPPFVSVAGTAGQCSKDEPPGMSSATPGRDDEACVCALCYEYLREALRPVADGAVKSKFRSPAEPRKAAREEVKSPLMTPGFEAPPLPALPAKLSDLRKLEGCIASEKAAPRAIALRLVGC